MRRSQNTEVMKSRKAVLLIMSLKAKLVCSISSAAENTVLCGD